MTADEALSLVQLILRLEGLLMVVIVILLWRYRRLFGVRL